jgi:nucleoside-diphosphate-sugar epimerase
VKNWKSALLRIASDVAVTSAALLITLAVRLFVRLFDDQPQPAAALLDEYLAYYRLQAPVLSLLVVAAFVSLGIYRNKLYFQTRYKLLAILQGLTAAYGVFLFGQYLLGFDLDHHLVPRGVFLLAFALNLAGASLLRLGRDYVDARRERRNPRQAGIRPYRRVLVVGGAGYIGSVTVRDLLEDGYRVRVLDSLVFGDASIRELYGHPNFELQVGDFRHVEPVVKAMREVDAVIHLGAIVGDPACAVNEDDTLETNLAATRLLADVCRASGVSRILFASTCSVYGAAESVVEERSWLNPVSLYAATKIDSERVLLDCRDKNFQPVILRLSTAFGWSYRPRFDLVVNLLTAKAHVEGKIVIYNGEQWRPFIHVKDISRAFRMALTAPDELVGGEVFNVGSDDLNLTLSELAEEIRRGTSGLQVEYVNNSDARTYKVSFSKIRNRLGFSTTVSLADGVAELREAIRLGLVADYTATQYSNLKVISENQPSTVAAVVPASLTALRFARKSWVTRVIEQSPDQTPATSQSLLFNSAVRGLQVPAGAPAESGRGTAA